MVLTARSDTAEAVTDRLRETIAALDPAVPVFNAGPANRTQFEHWAAESSVRVLAGVLGTLSLAIAILGVYAVVSYFVSRRTREFGLRIALGSTRGQIIKLVIDHGIHMVLIGLLPAVLLASLGTRVLQVELVKLQPNGITVWVVVPLMMLAAGVFAAYVPARRASRVEPNRTLKEL
jgi:ABC-type antimicrobial peptide transport system permease subunit